MTEDPNPIDSERRRGRGARSNRAGRYETELREAFDDGWESLGELDPFKTQVHRETARSIISRNDSPDLSFDRSINPYRGCEHGCIYCYARPTHAYLGHSPGLDFETRIYAKVNAAELLERELANPRYAPKVIALGAGDFNITLLLPLTVLTVVFGVYFAPLLRYANQSLNFFIK